MGDELRTKKEYANIREIIDICEQMCYNIVSSNTLSGGCKMELDNNNHSVFLMYYQLVLVVKYRRKVIDDTISDRLKEIFGYISKKYNIALQDWNHDYDHIHILFKAQPNSELSKFINAYKSASSRLIKKEYPQTARVKNNE